MSLAAMKARDQGNGLLLGGKRVRGGLREGGALRRSGILRAVARRTH